MLNGVGAKRITPPIEMGLDTGGLEPIGTDT